MSPLEQLQRSILQTLNFGPDYFEPLHFAGAQDRSILGLKVHANTISHARLVALEETFPRLRETMGDAPFNQISRQYVEWDGVRSLSLSHIGERFAQFLVVIQASEALAELAGFEWMWLGAYHAADAPVATLADLAGVDPQSLLDKMLERHPAALMVRFVHGPPSAIIRDANALEGADYLLLTRPDAEVLVSRSSAVEHAALSILTKSTRLCNLFEMLAEQGFEDSALDAVVALVRSGAIKQFEGEDG